MIPSCPSKLRTPSSVLSTQCSVLSTLRLALSAWLVLAAATACASPPITAAAFAPDGKSVIVGSQAGLAIHAWPELKPVGTLSTRLANIHDLAFSPGGGVLLVAGGKPAEEGAVEILSWPEGKQVARVMAGDDVVYSVDWRGDGGAFAAACGDRSVRLFSRDGKAVTRLEGHSRSVLAVRFLDEATLLSAGRDQSLRLWNLEGGRTLRTLDNHTASVAGLAVCPRSASGTVPRAASIAADRTLRLWQPTIGRLVRFARLPSEPLAVEWTADGSRVAAACADGRLRFIDPETVEIVDDVAALDGWAYTLARAPDEGAFLVAGQNGQMRRVVLP
jgi:hypothetical protein